MAVSSLPQSSEIESVLLELLGDKSVWRTKDFVAALADHYSLTAWDLEERLPKGLKRFYHRCNWAKHDLKEAGLVESAGYGSWRITQRGLDVLSGKELSPRPWHNWKPPQRG